MNRVTTYIALLLSLSVSISCSRPSSMETYILRDGSGRYEFTVDMSDSLSLYDLSFYTRTDELRHPSGFPMKVYLTSPSGREYVESVFFRIGDDPENIYRRGLEPYEHGIWKMTVYADADFITGLGLVTKVQTQQ